jgi:DNA adenine methylase
MRMLCERSPLRWAGSKRKLLPYLLQRVPDSYKRYIEPFCGSLSLYVAIKPEKALVGDINEELVHFYRMMKWRPSRVALLTHSMRRSAAEYYKIRRYSPKELGNEERAARFLYLNRFCFNGVYRTNAKGEFNVARGCHMGDIPPVQELLAFASVLRNAEVSVCDFSALLGVTSRDK